MNASLKSILCYSLLFILSTGYAQKKKESEVPAPPSSLQRLELEIARLSNLSGGKLGVYAQHVESGKKSISIAG